MLFPSSFHQSHVRYLVAVTTGRPRSTQLAYVQLLSQTAPLLQGATTCIGMRVYVGG